MGTEVPVGMRAFCLFSFGGRPMAVSVDAVEAFLDDARLVRLPLCPWPMSGLCTYRGGLLPAIQPFEGGGSDEGPEPRGQAVLGLRTGRGLLGLLVGRGEIAIVEDERADGAGGEAVGPPLPGGLVAAGTIERDGRSYPLIDPDRTWAAVRSLIERGYDAGRGIDAPPTRDASVGRGPGTSWEGGTR